MPHFQPITALSGPVEAVLRAALQAADRDVNGSLIAIRAGLSAGEMRAAVLTEGDTPLGLAIWRWEDPAHQYAAVDWLIVADWRAARQRGSPGRGGVGGRSTPGPPRP